MAVTQETVSVEQNTLAVGMAAAKLVKDIKAIVLKNPGGIGEVLGVVNAFVTDAVPALSAVSAVQAEASENSDAELNTLFLIGKAVYTAVKT